MEIEQDNLNANVQKGMLIFVLDLSAGNGLRVMTNTLVRDIFPWLDREVACAVVTTEGKLIAECAFMNPQNKKSIASVVDKLSIQSIIQSYTIAPITVYYTTEW